MYRCVLAPVDGTAFGEHALPLAATIARRAGALLRLVHVHVPMVAPVGLEAVTAVGPWNELLREQAAGYLEQLAARLRTALRAQVCCEVTDGLVPEMLSLHALEVGAELVVMSTHGRAGLRRMWHHCVAEQVMEGVSLPVLLVRPAEPVSEPDLSRPCEIHHLLIPVDGSVRAQQLLEHAVTLGRGFRARYTLLRVVEAPPVRLGARVGSSPFDPRSLEREQILARQRLAAFAERMRGAGLEVGAEVRVGRDPGEEIVRFVRDARGGPRPVDLVAMERHLHRGLGSALAVHTTDLVIRDAGVPVLLYPPEIPLRARPEAEVAARV